MRLPDNGFVPLNEALPLACRLAVRREGVRWTEHVLVVSVRRQQLTHFKLSRRADGVSNNSVLAPRRRYVISTSRFGVGQIERSNRTPLGLHRIAQKIGNGWPSGTAFKSRRVIGFTWQGLPEAKITTRILWLDGLEPGLNRGGNVDSFKRYIYIHGTGDETTLGRPASCGCIHLAATDLVPLFDRLPVGTLVWIGW